ncbi:Mobile element protein [Candidatus Rhodobacter oscarellae]|uniref:Mobile element protein n=1 Tax=Candidatus Rhodobacter oscarellae TaxID=1675527 RepID=A0A0J9E222_9RHOB|nr:Mobile element protein [Candidatus Rhodobacter lobularis]
MTKRSPLRYFKTSPEIIRLAVMMYVRLPLSLRNVEDLGKGTMPCILD